MVPSGAISLWSWFLIKIKNMNITAFPVKMPVGKSAMHPTLGVVKVIEIRGHERLVLAQGAHEVEEHWVLITTLQPLQVAKDFHCGHNLIHATASVLWENYTHVE